MATLKMRNEQIAWVRRMSMNLDLLHQQRYGNSTTMDRKLFYETDSKIREACRRLDIKVEDSEELAANNEWWDGERYGPIVVLEYAIGSIKKKVGIQ